MDNKRSKKASVITETPASFIRLARVHVPNSHHAAYQIEQVTLVGNTVTERKYLFHPDTLVMTLAKLSEAVDPESVVNCVPVVA